MWMQLRKNWGKSVLDPANPCEEHVNTEETYVFVDVADAFEFEEQEQLDHGDGAVPVWVL